jgi:hypothetical protein
MLLFIASGPLNSYQQQTHKLQTILRVNLPPVWRLRPESITPILKNMIEASIEELSDSPTIKEWTGIKNKIKTLARQQQPSQKSRLGALAQVVRMLPLDQKVPGSNPTPSQIFLDQFYQILDCKFWETLCVNS